jgi:hypothetical protein
LVAHADTLRSVGHLGWWGAARGGAARIQEPTMPQRHTDAISRHRRLAYQSKRPLTQFWSTRFRTIQVDPKDRGDTRGHTWGVRRPMLCRERGAIMLNAQSPSPWQLAVPGIGFPQNFSVGPNGPYPEAVRDWSRPTQGRKTDDGPMQFIDCAPWLSSSCPWREPGERFSGPPNPGDHHSQDRAPHRYSADSACSRRRWECCQEPGLLSSFFWRDYHERQRRRG